MFLKMRIYARSISEMDAIIGTETSLNIINLLLRLLKFALQATKSGFR